MSKTLLIDLDGTLTDPEEGILNSINAGLEALGHSAQPNEALRRFIGPPLDPTFRELLPTASDEEIAVAMEAYKVRFLDVGWRENLPFEEVREPLAELVRRGYVLRVCTVKGPTSANRITKHFDLAKHFASIHGCERRQSKAELISEMKAEGLCDETSWMIGDRASDIEAGRVNGLSTVGVLWGFGTEEELRAAEPDGIVGHASELLNLFT